MLLKICVFPNETRSHSEKILPIQKLREAALCLYTFLEERVGTLELCNGSNLFSFPFTTFLKEKKLYLQRKVYYKKIHVPSSKWFEDEE